MLASLVSMSTVCRRAQSALVALLALLLYYGHKARAIPIDNGVNGVLETLILALYQ